ncbi:hypothetical protein [Candidatus Villigracilis affinis]|uniref:hypothetical protein n=1 Tax=Candidatus Villigracilis affinis TaxID=3140682 RepID=UPI002A1EED28|nr:hypothetical protein [Anaerolineales bacterium]
MHCASPRRFSYDLREKVRFTRATARHSPSQKRHLISPFWPGHSDECSMRAWFMLWMKFEERSNQMESDRPAARGDRWAVEVASRQEIQTAGQLTDMPISGRADDEATFRHA